MTSYQRTADGKEVKYMFKSKTFSFTLPVMYDAILTTREFKDAYRHICSLGDLVNSQHATPNHGACKVLTNTLEAWKYRVEMLDLYRKVEAWKKEWRLMLKDIDQATEEEYAGED
ncbi:MAG: hypothetical protein Q9180_008703 [Flavoplaca navasiana]